jgi:membrane protease YdiL (CAAX protease family)
VTTFTRNEKIILLVAAVVAAAAGVFAWANFTRAFPEAHLTFAVNRVSSQPVAERFLRERAPVAAAALSGRRHAAIFQVEDNAKIYLERELGLERFGELTRAKQVRLWSWSHRYFRPLDKEEVRVEVAPEGEVIGFAHLIAEGAVGATLDETAARAVAERFLKGAFGLAPGGMTFIESKREDRPHRRDWTLTFERTGWKASEATYRMRVEVHGDEAAGYSEYLKIPDAWTQGYKRLRAANETTGLGASFGIILTILAAVVVLLREGRRGNVRWRIVFLFTGVAFALFFLLSLNDLPVSAYRFDTTGTFGAFLAGEVVKGIASAGLEALLIFIVVAAGEPLYRARFPQHPSVRALLQPAGWRSKKVAFGLILGYCLAVIFLAYQVVFYLVGKHFGAWNPAEVPFDNLLNTWFPWLAVLLIGFYPAVSEEFMSRVFSIPLVEKLTHSKAAAIVIPALIWGFAHSAYPAQPFFIRGVEVSLAGLVVGIILYRFGVIPCLVWHYVVDAGYTSMLLVRSGNLYFVVTAIAGVGALLVPLAVALVGAWRRGGFVEDTALDNAADPAPPEPAPAPEAAPPVIVAPPQRRLAAVAILALVGGLALALKAPDPGRGVGVTARPAAVQKTAEEFLRARGVDAATWRLVVTTTNDVLGADTRRYLLEHGGSARIARAAADVPQWQVRAFRPEEREEWRLSVDDRSGRVVRFQHMLKEETAGASLPVAEARGRAEAALKAAGFDAAALVFREVKSEKRPARTDHTFTWKDSGRSVAEAEYLLDVTVQGDSVDGFTRRFKLPEAWERAREKSTTVQWLLVAVRISVLALLVVHGLLVFYRGMRANLVPWRRLIPLTALVALLVGVGEALSFPLLWERYQAAMPAALFRTAMLITMLLGLLFLVAFTVLALATAIACIPSARAACYPQSRRPVAATALLAALAVIGLWLARAGLRAFAAAALPLAFTDLPVTIPSELATLVPSLAGLGGTLVGGLAALALIATTVHLWRGLPDRRLRLALGVGLWLTLIPGGATKSLPEFAEGAFHATVTLAVAVLLIRFVLGENPVAYLATAMLLTAAGAGIVLVSQPGASYVTEGAVFLVVALAATVAWLWRRGAATTG